MIPKGTDPVLHIVLLTSAVMIMSTIVIMAIILFMRRLQLREDRDVQSFRRKWLPLMVQAVEGRIRVWPRVEKRHYYHFLILWNEFQSNLSGDSQQGLNRLALDLGINKVAVKMLDSRSESERILGALTLGNLAYHAAQEKIQRIALNSLGLAGQVAALSLVKIDPAQATPIIIELYAKRGGWSQSKMASILKSLGPANVTPALIEWIEKSEDDVLPRLIQGLNFVKPDAAADIVRKILTRTEDVEVIAACLKQVKQFGDLAWVDVIRPYMKHQNWVIRVQAVNALSGLATIHELPDLIYALSDNSWWVRYRSAQALCSHPAMNEQKLQQIIDNETDRYAVDMLQQVIAERRMRAGA